MYVKTKTYIQFFIPVLFRQLSASTDEWINNVVYPHTEFNNKKEKVPIV